jgi:predicted Zn-dependent protease
MLDGLLSSDPDVVEFVVTRAEVDRQQGNYDAALERLRRSLATRPGSMAVNLAYAETALDANQPDAAMQSLQRFVAYVDDEPWVYKLLSRAAGELGEQAKGHEYLAQHYYLLGETQRAAMQIEIALKQPGLDFFEVSRLESRLAALNSELDVDDRRPNPAR